MMPLRLHRVVLAATLLLTVLAACERPPQAPPVGGATPTPGGQTGNTGGQTGNSGPLASRVDSYLALAPRVLRVGQTEKIAVSLFDGARAAAGDVQVTLLKDGQRLATGAARVAGRGAVGLPVPQLAEGEYELQVSGSGFTAKSAVRVEDGTLVFVETDKPVYKPGQTVHVRAITLDAQLKPVAGAVTVEVADAKGIKVFKKDVQSDEFGMANLDMPVSPEPNLGVWKIAARAGKRIGQVDVRIERYVLPKYEVKVDLAKDWFLANEAITGTVSAEYSYGKPVQGEVQIKATRYAGTWQEFANVTRTLKGGAADFQLPAVRYVSGVPAAKGMGNVQLEVVVREPATGYEEKTNRLLNIAASPVVLQAIPESVTFKPSLPVTLLIVAETPDKKPVDAAVRVDVSYTKQDFSNSQARHQVSVQQGKAMLRLTPPADAISLSLSATSGGAHTALAMQSGYSPSGSFIHVEQVADGALHVGDTAKFKVASTREAANFYYEVVARGMVVFSELSRTADIALPITPQMAPKARLLVYQILPTSEVAADYVPFTVEGRYPQQVAVGFGKAEVQPGEEVDLSVQTEGPAKVGLAAVDRSVFILAENRLNLQQVFGELERLYQQPQVELHEARPLDKVVSRGAKEVFGDAGLVVLTNKQVPDGKEFASPLREMRDGVRAGVVAPMAAAPAGAPAPAVAKGVAEDAAQTGGGGLAEVQRVRQFFPETWLWSLLQTDAAGRATQRVTAPDSITTWMVRAVALSTQAGLGIAEAQLRVFQPFFVQIDLPYSAIRGEQLPVKVALYNYRNTPEDFQIDLDEGDWFDLADQPRKSVRVGPNDVGGVSFTIRPGKLGKQQVKVTARSQSVADAIVKDFIVEPEGVAREQVENLVLSAGGGRDLALGVPDNVIEGSARAFLALTGSYMTQSIEGLEKLLQMPFGCGEQNMILFAPNVFVSRYLKETGQLKPEVMAKAENLMITGYQRELTYRRREGSFSAFGEQDKDGSLWLTAFVLKTFAQAKEVVFIDDAVLQAARGWIVQQQKGDGSFEPVGFVHHQELLGGLKGKTALTAYLAVALREAGEDAASAKAVRYLEGALEATEDPYALAIGSYALTLAKSAKAPGAINRLMGKAHESDGGLFWGEEGRPEPLPGPPMPAPRVAPRPNQSASIETTGYATLALLEHGDRMNAGRATRWLVSRRNAYGGFGSTQDTVVGLQALTKYAAGAKSDVDATVTLRSGNWQKEVRISAENADVLQVVDVPIGGQVNVAVRGKGQVVLQGVRRFNVPDPEQKAVSAFQIDVSYGTGRIEVNDLITLGVTVRFTPPEPMQAGMVVLDVAVPTGFAAVNESLDKLAKQQAKVKRYDVAGRKVIIYIEDMMPNEQINFSFEARALYPVRAQAVTSQAYSYYRPEWKGESLGGAVVVGGGS